MTCYPTRHPTNTHIQINTPAPTKRGGLQIRRLPAIYRVKILNGRLGASGASGAAVDSEVSADWAGSWPAPIRTRLEVNRIPTTIPCKVDQSERLRARRLQQTGKLQQRAEIQPKDRISNSLQLSVPAKFLVEASSESPARLNALPFAFTREGIRILSGNLYGTQLHRRVRFNLQRRLRPVCRGRGDRLRLISRHLRVNRRPRRLQSTIKNFHPINHL